MVFGGFQPKKFTTKLFVAVVALCVVSILGITWNAIRMSDNGLQSLGEKELINMHRAVYNALDLYEGNVQKKLESDLDYFHQRVIAKGGLILATTTPAEMTATDVNTGQSEQVQLPKMMAGGSFITGHNDITDNVSHSTGSIATVYQLSDNRLVAVSTSLQTHGGERALGIALPADSKPYQETMQDNTFTGKIKIDGTWYIATYAPLHDAGGKVVGALSISQPMVTPLIKKYILNTKIGDGYFYMYTKDGKILIHPTLPVGKDLFKLVPALKDLKNGLTRYTFQGKTRISYVQYFPDWDVYINASTSREDIIGGLDVVMLQHSLLVGAAMLIAAILVTMLLVRAINKPLLALAEKSVKVGEGDYTIVFNAKTDDAIGKLAGALNTMVTKAKEMLEDIVNSSQSLSSASTELAAISEQMVGNADATTQIADSSEGHAREVSDNMHSVSAAMEQSTTNLDMIAAASEQMGNTIKDIAENSARARNITEEAVDKAHKSHVGVQELGEAARAIGTVTETITEISDQTNLLALNATIEAARAGEAGKGFAVVANEIKELAKETAKATGKIRDAIEDIQNQTEVTVEDIESIATVIQDVNDVVNSIVTSMEEQSITTNEIVSNVGQASQGATEISENISNSTQMASQMSDGLSQMKEKSMEVKSSSQHVRTSAEELSKLSEKLSMLVSRFKI